MQSLLPYVINGISAGGQYALIAIGYTLVYGILRLINFAHGDVFMVAGLVMVYATTAMPFYIALPLVLTAVYAFLSIRFDGTSILDFLKYAAAFLITKQQFYDWRLES